jgi:hypothetical protein
MSERELKSPFKLKRCLRCHAPLDPDDQGELGLCYACAECSHTLVHWMIQHGIPPNEKT